ncbi:MAG: UDP-N-acetylmuramoyl-tripeptide--D-alanyl-D-alanine ligase [Planctomycetota bacterium]
MRAEELATVTGGRWVGLKGSLDLREACIDTRLLKPGQVFVALRTARDDGHRHLASAFERGAAAALVEEPSTLGPCLVVPHAERALQRWGAAVRRQFRGQVIGVVGSVGKTTAKELLHALISSVASCHRSPQSFNNHLGLPLTILSTPDESRFMVLEMGANRHGDLDLLGSISRPDHLFVVPIGGAHLEGFGSLEGVREAKGEILGHLKPTGWLAWPHDPELQMAWSWPGRSFTYGESPQAQARPESCRVEFPRTRVRVRGEDVIFHFPAPHMGGMLAGALGLCDRLGLKTSLECLAGFRPPQGRLNVSHHGGITLVDDAYNANPLSVGQAVRVLAEAPPRRVLVLGDMLELGDHARELHEGVGREAKGRVDLLIAVGPLASCAAEAFGPGALCFPDSVACARELPGILKSGDTVLVKGSHSMKLDQVVAALPRRETA